MKRARLIPAVAAVAFVGLVLPAAPARAVGEVATQVIIAPLEPAVVGQPVDVVVELRRADGTPIVDEPVVLTSNGEHVRRSRTKADGRTSITLPRNMAPGEYTLVVNYAGRVDAYLPSTAQTVLEIRPIQLEVLTVPPVPGVRLALNDVAFTVGPDGVGRLEVDRVGEHRLRVLEEEFVSEEVRARFSRWNDDVFGPDWPITVPSARSLEAGFDISYQAGQRFVDLDGNPVDPERITSIRLRSSLGSTFELTDGRPRWYKASRVVRRLGGLESVEVRYNVEEVIVDGSNVVNSGQQRYYLRGHTTWELELLLFKAHVRTSDALLGFPVDGVVEVTYPDGTVDRIAPEANGEIRVRGLARGEYRMKVADAPGWAPTVPVAVSRDQEVVLRVISYVDVAIAFLVASGLVLGLLHFGRPHLIPSVVGGIGRAGQRGLQAPSRLVSIVGGRAAGGGRVVRSASTGAPDPPPISLGRVVEATITAPRSDPARAMATWQPPLPPITALPVGPVSAEVDVPAPPAADQPAGPAARKARRRRRGGAAASGEPSTPEASPGQRSKEARPTKASRKGATRANPVSESSVSEPAASLTSAVERRRAQLEALGISPGEETWQAGPPQPGPAEPPAIDGEDRSASVAESSPATSSATPAAADGRLVGEGVHVCVRCGFVAPNATPYCRRCGADQRTRYQGVRDGASGRARPSGGRVA